jgi:hypothetical protein
VEGQPGRGRGRGFGERRRRRQLSRALRRGGRCVFFFSRAIGSADACGTSGVGTVRSGGARGKARVRGEGAAQGEGAEVDGQR